MFQLTREEIESVKSQFVISPENNFFEGQSGGRRTLPSSKDAGEKLCAINKIENTEMIHPVIDNLLLGADNII